MKFVLMVIALGFFLQPSFALASAPEDGMHTEEDQCFFDLTVLARRDFSDRNLSSQWCTSIHNLFGFEQSCFIRQHNDGRWIGSFRHQRRFQGNSYDGIFRGYTQWSDRHLFRGARFEHRIRFSQRCFGRDNGGGGY